MGIDILTNVMDTSVKDHLPKNKKIKENNTAKVTHSGRQNGFSQIPVNHTQQYQIYITVSEELTYSDHVSNVFRIKADK